MNGPPGSRKIKVDFCGKVYCIVAGSPAEKEKRQMFDFRDKKKKKVFIWIIVVILILAMVVPTAYSLIAALAG